MNDHVLYTYQSFKVDGLAESELVCHAYGPASEADCKAAGEKLTAASVSLPNAATPLQCMVLPLEAMPS